MNKLIVFAFLSVASIGCGNIQQKAKETINKGGEVVGKSATEFVDGVSDGVNETLQCDLILSSSLMERGIEKGKYLIADSLGGDNNLLALYLIFNKDFNDSISAKAFDENGLEMGRQSIRVVEKSGNAGYFDFIFDKRTKIESESKITIE